MERRDRTHREVVHVRVSVRRLRRRQGERGHSLMEFLVAMVLGAFVVLGMEVAWWNSSKIVIQGTSQLELQRDAAFVLDSIANASRSAASFTIANFGTHVANLVILKNSAGTELWRFYWNDTDNKVYAAQNGGTASVFIASTVQNLAFSASGKELTASLTLGDTYAQTAPFVTTAWLRN